MTSRVKKHAVESFCSKLRRWQKNVHHYVISFQVRCSQIRKIGLPRNISDKSWLRNPSISCESYPTANKAAVIAPALDPANLLILPLSNAPIFSNTYIKTWRLVREVLIVRRSTGALCTKGHCVGTLFLSGCRELLLGIPEIQYRRSSFQETWRHNVANNNKGSRIVVSKKMKTHTSRYATQLRC